MRWRPPAEQAGSMPFVMAPGVCWSHVMIVHDSEGAARPDSGRIP
jgi:hypothetical protein